MAQSDSSRAIFPGRTSRMGGMTRPWFQSSRTTAVGLQSSVTIGEASAQ